MRMKRTASALIILAATTGFAFAQGNYQGSEKGPVSHPGNKLPETLPDGTKVEPSPNNRATPSPHTTGNDKSAIQPDGRPQK
jgi:hypothetical protein